MTENELCKNIYEFEQWRGDMKKDTYELGHERGVVFTEYSYVERQKPELLQKVRELFLAGYSSEQIRSMYIIAHASVTNGNPEYRLTDLLEKIRYELEPAAEIPEFINALLNETRIKLGDNGKYDIIVPGFLEYCASKGLFKNKTLTIELIDTWFNHGYSTKGKSNALYKAIKAARKIESLEDEKINARSKLADKELLAAEKMDNATKNFIKIRKKTGFAI
jgi:hypothetical protein